MDQLDGAEGWVWYNAAIERENQRHGGSEIRIVGRGYVQQEKARLKQNLLR